MSYLCALGSGLATSEHNHERRQHQHTRGDPEPQDHSGVRLGVDRGEEHTPGMAWVPEALVRLPDLPACEITLRLFSRHPLTSTPLSAMLLALEAALGLPLLPACHELELSKRTPIALASDPLLHLGGDQGRADRDNGSLQLFVDILPFSDDEREQQGKDARQKERRGHVRLSVRPFFALGALGKSLARAPLAHDYGTRTRTGQDAVPRLGRRAWNTCSPLESGHLAV